MPYRVEIATPTGWVPARSIIPPPPSGITVTIQVPANAVAGDIITLSSVVAGADIVVSRLWTVSAGLLSSATSATPQWTLPAVLPNPQGTVTVTLTVESASQLTGTGTRTVTLSSAPTGENPYGSYWVGRVAVPRIRPNWAGLTEDVIDWSALDPAAPPINGANPVRARLTSSRVDWSEANATTTIPVPGLGDVPVIENVDLTASGVFFDAATTLIVRNFTAPGNGGSQSVSARAQSSANRRGGRVIFVDGDVRAGATNGIVFGDWSAIAVRVRGDTDGGQDLGRINGRCYLERVTGFDHRRSTAANVHGDVFQAQNAVGTVIRECWIRAGEPSDYMNSALAFYADTGPISDVLVEDCYLNGGNITLDASAKSNSIARMSANRVIFGGFAQFQNSRAFNTRLCFQTDGSPV